jgi:Fe-S-cluster containining protein
MTGDFESDADTEEENYCPIFVNTHYQCEKCGKKCCFPRAKYNPDDEDRSRGHGYIRNHVAGDSRCQ